MKFRSMCLLGAVGVAVPFAMSASAANITLGWDAATYDDDGSWEVNASDSGSPSLATVRWNNGTTDVLVNSATNFVNINDYVTTPNFVLNRPSDNGGSWQDVLGDAATKVDTTWEMVFSPGDFTGIEPIFDTGGTGAGTGLRMIGNNLNFRFQDANTAGNFLELNADLSAIGAATDFYHVVAVQDIANASSVTALYVNGLLVASGGDTSAITDWDGGDDAGLGRVGGSSPQGASFTGNFDGSVAVFRNYNSQILDGSESRNLFAATTGNRRTATMGWDAADYDGNGTWETSESDPNVASAGNTTWHGSGTLQTGSTNFANVNAWLSNPNFTQGNLTSSAGPDDSFDDELGNAFSQRDTTWEAVFRPGDYSGKHILVEHGGSGSGVIIQIDGSTLSYVAQGGNTSTQQVFEIDLSTIDTADQFFHIVASLEVGTTGNADGLSGLYVNGILIDDIDNSGGTDVVNDWAGSDGGGIGKKTGTSSFGNQTYSAFDGDLAILRLYNDQAFDQAAVDAAYAELVPEPSSLALLGLGGLAMLRRRR